VNTLAAGYYELSEDFDDIALINSLREKDKDLFPLDSAQYIAMNILN